MRLVNAIAALVIVACAVIAVKVVMTPTPPPPSSHRDLGSDAAAARSLAAEVVAYRPGSNDAHTPLHAAPLDPFATARVGDWRAAHVITDNKLVRDATGGAIHATSIEVVSAMTDATVTTQFRGIIDGETTVRDGESGTHQTPRHGATFEQLVASEWAISDFAITDDTYAIAGHTFHCKKATYREIDPMLPRKDVRVELWLSPEVPVTGVVARHEVQTIDKLTFTIDVELAGFGNGSAAAWGQRPAGL